MKDNKGSVSSPQILLAAVKATIRGHIMRDSAIANKRRIEQQTILENDIKTLTHAHFTNPTEASRYRLEKAKMELNTLYTSKAEYKLYRVKTRNYEQGEKAGHFDD